MPAENRDVEGTCSAAFLRDIGSGPAQRHRHRANSGYLRHYSDNRAVMRAFMEATMVDARYRDMWWYMRERHINRFVGALEGVYGIRDIAGCPIRTIVEALASMTEQSAYTWFAQDELNGAPVSLELATEVITNIWHSTIFAQKA